MKALRPGDRLLVMVVGLALLIIGAVVWAQADGVVRVDRLAEGREQQLVENGLRMREAEIRRNLYTEAVWDDAVANLDRRWNPAWAEANIISFFTGASGFTAVYVLDGRDQVRLAYLQGDRAQPAEAIRARLVELAVPLRRAEARRAPFAKADGKRLISQPIEASEVTEIAGQPYILAASLVQPDFGKAFPGPRAPIIFVGQKLDQGFVGWLGRYYLLRDARMIAPSAAVPPGFARTPLADSQGRVLAQVAWRPAQPAHDLARRLAAPRIACFLLLVSLVVVVWRRERRRNQALQAAQAASAAASAAKSAFLAHVSHEIRTPLNGIVGMAQVLGRGLTEPAHRDQLEVILESGRALTGVLNDVLDLAKIEAGHLAISPAPCDLVRGLKLTCAAFDSLADEKGLEFHLELEPGLEGVWRIDEPRLRQILSNLLSNALKFTRRGAVTVSVAVSDGRLGLAVRDSGIGIAPDRLSAVFEEYVQAEAATARTFGGTGLGLPISRRLAQLMGGDLTVTSELGAGATFHLELPVEFVEAAAGAGSSAADTLAETSAATDFSGLRLLAAEDNATNRLLLQALLQPFGLDLTFAEDGEAAVEAFASGAFDLVLMDVRMPKLDGVEATRRIRALEQARGGARVPILALSADVMTGQIEAYSAAGMDGYVEKPVDLSRLLGAIAAAIEGESPSASAPAQSVTATGQGVATTGTRRLNNPG